MLCASLHCIAASGIERIILFFRWFELLQGCDELCHVATIFVRLIWNWVKETWWIAAAYTLQDVMYASPTTSDLTVVADIRQWLLGHEANGESAKSIRKMMQRNGDHATHTSAPASARQA
jgi:hypothetical protein